VSNFSEIIEDTLAEVSSYVKNQEAITVLTQAATDSDTTLTVDEASSVSRGLVEIGDELIYVKSVNQTAGTLTVLPGGRGWRGTTATAHGVNALLRNNPTFPRDQVKRALNDTIRGIDLRALSSHEFTFDGTAYAYVLPTDFQDVTGVAWDAPDTTEVWPIIRRFRVDRNYRVEGDASTVRSAIVLNEYPMPGRTVRVQYAKYPTPLANPSDDFSTVTGLPASAEDVIRLGAMWRLVSTIDPGKVVAMTPSADLVDSPVGPGDSTSVARYLYQLFSVRLAEEKAKQQDNYISTIQYAR
jgi:hypothetical protein